MRLPIRPLRLIREFCAFRQVVYGCRRTINSRIDAFHISSTRYELVPESGVVVVSSLARDFPDDVIVLDPPPHRMGKVDEDHAVTLAHHAGIALVRVYRIVSRAGESGKKVCWSLVSSVMGEAAQNWEIYSAHRSGISIMGRDYRPARCVKVLDWDWRNDQVVSDYYRPYSCHPHDESLVLEKIQGMMYQIGSNAYWCQIRNTRFLDDDTLADVALRSESSVDGTEIEIHVDVRVKEAGRPAQRIPIHDSLLQSKGTTHILESRGRCSFSSSAPRSFPIYIQTCTGFGFLILDRSAATMRSFKLADMRSFNLADDDDDDELRRALMRAAATARLGGDAVVQWLRWPERLFPSFACVSSLLPIEIDGEGDEWVRLAMFGFRLHYVVDICLRTWRATLIGFFTLLDNTSVPLGMVHYSDHNVDILQELDL
jgi:hypothetical protein